MCLSIQNGTNQFKLTFTFKWLLFNHFVYEANESSLEITIFAVFLFKTALHRIVSVEW